MEKERINAAELSRRLEVTRGAVSKAVKSGRITPGEDGLFDPEEAELQWRANTRTTLKASASPAARNKSTHYAEARARKETAAASMLEMQEAQMRGKVVDTQLCTELAANVGWAWREFVDTLPVHLARAVYGKQGFQEIEIAIDTEIQTLMAPLPDLVDRAALQAVALKLPPSPLEKAILERMQAGVNARARETIRMLLADVARVYDPEPLCHDLERLADTLAPAVVSLGTVEEVRAHIIKEVEGLYLAYAERLLDGVGKLAEVGKVPA